ncbi:hypothetical protein [Terriglobus roseus]|uniref:hypothetical protein n=1 Tax=Terriglobus roseus TaxID=392734 RepID=UPI0012E9AB6F|nr:hypothetical protein [Terriglobus roseus]
MIQTSLKGVKAEIARCQTGARIRASDRRLMDDSDDFPTLEQAQLSPTTALATHGLPWT